MALTGIEIFKKLPKTNCGECGVPTCLAFAMKLAAGQAELAACPHVSEEAKAELSEASAPPIRPVTIGTGDDALTVGGETVLFRHEKTFIKQPGIGIAVDDTMDSADLEQRVKALHEYALERVGGIGGEARGEGRVDARSPRPGRQRLERVPRAHLRGRPPQRDPPFAGDGDPGRASHAQSAAQRELQLLHLRHAPV